MKKIYGHLSPSIAGLRMPVSSTYVVFLKALKDLGVIFDILEVRKTGPQLFIMLIV